MKKQSPIMRWKNILYASLLLLLILNLTTTSVGALPYLSVDPPTEIISAPGEEKTIKINITDVEDLFGFDLWIDYNSSFLEVTEVTVVGTGQVVPTDPSKYSYADLSVNGTVKVGVAFLEALGAVPFDGNGTLLWITFNGTALGANTIDISDTQTYLYNSWAMEIEMDTAIDGEITVISEFPAAVTTLLLLMTTLAATLLGKIVWSRKRRGPATK